MAEVLLVTAAHNEARYAERLVAGVRSQVQLPDRWLIVDDGSTDGTFEALSREAADLRWATVLRRDASNGDGACDRLAAAATPCALNWALARTDWASFTHIGKLDADVELPPDFLARLLEDFDGDPRLGMAAGPLTERRHGRWCRVPQAATHPPAPARLYTRQCFEAVGGFHERLGWDAIDEIYARMLGFRTTTDPDAAVHHLRPIGSADGSLRGRARHGECAWIVHQQPLWVALRSLKVAVTSRPVGVTGLAFLWGYVRAALRAVPRVDDPEFRRFVRKELRARLRSI